MIARKSNAALAYFALAAIGLIATWAFNFRFFFSQPSAFSAYFDHAMVNDVTRAITIDVFIAAIAFSIWIFVDARRAQVKAPLLYVALTFIVGLCVALPLYLGMRERARATA